MTLRIFPAPPLESMPSDEETALVQAFQRYDQAILAGRNPDNERRMLVRTLIQMFGTPKE